MRFILTTLLLSLSFSGAMKGQVFTAKDWALASDEITRLHPSEFISLPFTIREELERRRCTIPQVYADDVAGNVVTGRFFSDSQTDIAILCSRNNISSILVFRDGQAASVEELASAADEGYLQDIGSGQVGFSRELNIASPQVIQSYYELWGGPQPPTLNHVGIIDAFVGKGSVIRYWYEGRWVNLRGSD